MRKRRRLFEDIPLGSYNLKIQFNPNKPIGNLFNNEEGTDLSYASLEVLFYILGFILAPLTIYVVILWCSWAGYFHAECPGYEGRECNWPNGRCASTGFCECINPLYSGEKCQHTLCPGYDKVSNEECLGRGMCNPLTYLPKESPCKEEFPSAENNFIRRGGWQFENCKSWLKSIKNPNSSQIVRCQCFMPFYGEQCSRVGCPVDTLNRICSGNGDLKVDYWGNDTTVGKGCQCINKIHWLEYQDYSVENQRFITGQKYEGYKFERFFEHAYCGPKIEDTAHDYVWVNSTVESIYRCYCDLEHYSGPEGVCAFGKCPTNSDDKICSGHGHKHYGGGFQANAVSRTSPYGCQPKCSTDTKIVQTLGRNVSISYYLCPSTKKCVEKRTDNLPFDTHDLKLFCLQAEYCPSDKPIRCASGSCVSNTPHQKLSGECISGYDSGTYDFVYSLKRGRLVPICTFEKNDRCLFTEQSESLDCVSTHNPQGFWSFTPPENDNTEMEDYLRKTYSSSYSMDFLNYVLNFYERNFEKILTSLDNDEQVAALNKTFVEQPFPDSKPKCNHVIWRRSFQKKMMELTFKYQLGNNQSSIQIQWNGGIVERFTQYTGENWTKATLKDWGGENNRKPFTSGNLTYNRTHPFYLDLLDPNFDWEYLKDGESFFMGTGNGGDAVQVSFIQRRPPYYQNALMYSEDQWAHLYGMIGEVSLFQEYKGLNELDLKMIGKVAIDNLYVLSQDDIEVPCVCSTSCEESTDILENYYKDRIIHNLLLGQNYTASSTIQSRNPSILTDGTRSCGAEGEGVFLYPLMINYDRPLTLYELNTKKWLQMEINPSKKMNYVIITGTRGGTCELKSIQDEFRCTNTQKNRWNPSLCYKTSIEKEYRKNEISSTKVHLIENRPATEDECGNCIDNACINVNYCNTEQNDPNQCCEPTGEFDMGGLVQFPDCSTPPSFQYKVINGSITGTTDTAFSSEYKQSDEVSYSPLNSTITLNKWPVTIRLNQGVVKSFQLSMTEFASYDRKRYQYGPLSSNLTELLSNNTITTQIEEDFKNAFANYNMTDINLDENELNFKVHGERFDKTTVNNKLAQSIQRISPTTLNITLVDFREDSFYTVEWSQDDSSYTEMKVEGDSNVRGPTNSETFILNSFEGHVPNTTHDFSSIPMGGVQYLRITPNCTACSFHLELITLPNTFNRWPVTLHVSQTTDMISGLKFYGVSGKKFEVGNFTVQRRCPTNTSFIDVGTFSGPLTVDSPVHHYFKNAYESTCSLKITPSCMNCNFRLEVLTSTVYTSDKNLTSPTWYPLTPEVTLDEWPVTIRLNEGKVHGLNLSQSNLVKYDHKEYRFKPWKKDWSDLTNTIIKEEFMGTIKNLDFKEKVGKFGFTLQNKRFDWNITVVEQRLERVFNRTYPNENLTLEDFREVSTYKVGIRVGGDFSDINDDRKQKTFLGPTTSSPETVNFFEKVMEDIEWIQITPNCQQCSYKLDLVTSRITTCSPQDGRGSISTCSKSCSRDEDCGFHHVSFMDSVELLPKKYTETKYEWNTTSYCEIYLGKPKDGNCDSYNVADTTMLDSLEVMKFRLHWNTSLNDTEKYEIEHLNRNTGLGIKWWNNEWWNNVENIRWNYVIFTKDPFNFTAEILNEKFEKENKRYRLAKITKVTDINCYQKHYGYTEENCTSATFTWKPEPEPINLRVFVGMQRLTKENLVIPEGHCQDYVTRTNRDIRGRNPPPCVESTAGAQDGSRCFAGDGPCVVDGQCMSNKCGLANCGSYRFDTLTPMDNCCEPSCYTLNREDCAEKSNKPRFFPLCGDWAETLGDNEEDYLLFQANNVECFRTTLDYSPKEMVREYYCNDTSSILTKTRGESKYLTIVNEGGEYIKLCEVELGSRPGNFEYFIRKDAKTQTYHKKSITDKQGYGVWLDTKTANVGCSQDCPPDKPFRCPSGKCAGKLEQEMRVEESGLCTSVKGERVPINRITSDYNQVEVINVLEDDEAYFTIPRKDEDWIREYPSINAVKWKVSFTTPFWFYEYVYLESPLASRPSGEWNVTRVPNFTWVDSDSILSFEMLNQTRFIQHLEVHSANSLHCEFKDKECWCGTLGLAIYRCKCFNLGLTTNLASPLEIDTSVLETHLKNQCKQAFDRLTCPKEIKNGLRRCKTTCEVKWSRNESLNVVNPQDCPNELCPLGKPYRCEDGRCSTREEDCKIEYYCYGNGCYQYHTGVNEFGCICEQGYSGLDCRFGVCTPGIPETGTVPGNNVCSCGGPPPLRARPACT